MSSAPENRDPEPPADSMSDSCFWPRPVDPDEAKKRAPTVDVDRSVVELTSPIGHRLRVPAADAELLLAAAPPVVSGKTPPSPKRKL